MDKLSDDRTEASELDVRCSAACTRAGLTLIVFCALALSLLAPLERAVAFNALGNYVTLRLRLKDVLESLYSEPCWKHLNAILLKDQPVRTWAIEKLSEFECDPHDYVVKQPEKIAAEELEKGVVKKPEMRKEDEKTSNDKPHVPIPPGPVKGIRLVSRLNQFAEIKTILATLCDDGSLKLARNYSYRYGRLIWRWQTFRDRVFGISPSGVWFGSEGGKTTVILDSGRSVDISRHPLNRRQDFVPLLNIEEVQLLADYELPDLVDLERSLREMERINLPTLGFPLGPLSGSIFVEFGLVITMLYFWLFLREAKLSDRFPAQGTLFGVFARTRSTRILLLALAAIPAVSAGLVAYRSLTLVPFNGITAAGILFLTINVVRELHYQDIKRPKRQTSSSPSSPP